MAYVALTRAVRELCVYVTDYNGKSYPEADNVGACLHDALSASCEISPGSGEDATGKERYMLNLAGMLRPEG